MRSDTVVKCTVATCAVAIFVPLFYCSYLLAEVTAEFDKLCQSVGMRRAEVSTEGFARQVCTDDNTNTFFDVEFIDGKYELVNTKD